MPAAVCADVVGGASVAEKRRQFSSVRLTAFYTRKVLRITKVSDA